MYHIKVFLILLSSLWGTLVYSKTVSYSLSIDEKKISFGGASRTGLAINDSIPGPVLRFKKGDLAKIRVYNLLDKEKTILHWHGLLVPNEQDGVPELTTPPIPPGGYHDYEFQLTHTGTYWYHSHLGLQEQRGVYGAIVVEPDKPVEQAGWDLEKVVILSDWTNENPKEVLRSLRRGDEWYSVRKGSIQSIWGAYRAGMLGTFLDNQWVNMPPMDISDVAYDAFWVNGKPSIDVPEASGKRVKLRIINAGASTYFYVHSSTGPIKIVAADGMDVEPVDQLRLLIGNGENYDVIVSIPPGEKHELRATAQDGTGHASLFLGKGKASFASNIPKPDLYGMEWMLAGLELDEVMENEMEAPRPLSPYDKFRSLRSTAMPTGASRREIELRLTGNMERYVWSFNGKTLKQDPTIHLTKGEVVRMNFINDTMMHHPLHLHGHFFRLLNGQGDFAPLKHTIDVPPMGKRSIEFFANEEGDWVFHCHQLYHMKTGMTRILSYREQGPDHKPNLDLSKLDPWGASMDAMVSTKMTEGRVGLRKAMHDLNFIWEHAFEHQEYEFDLQWSRLIDFKSKTLIGARSGNFPERYDRFYLGYSHRLPFLSQATVTIDHDAELRLGLAKDLPLTQHIFWGGEIQYESDGKWELKTGLDYRVSKELAVVTRYHSDHQFGFGLRLYW
jgi:FtsP/CotA-like multicopper oxidase with cupredoxin domain